jgi:hypothetical protein
LISVGALETQINQHLKVAASSDMDVTHRTRIVAAHREQTLEPCQKNQQNTLSKCFNCAPFIKAFQWGALRNFVK